MPYLFPSCSSAQAPGFPDYQTCSLVYQEPGAGSAVPTVHAFYQNDSGILMHRRLTASGLSAAQTLDAGSPSTVPVIRPRAFADGDIVGCVWSSKLTASVALAPDPQYTVSTDGGGSWPATPYFLVPGYVPGAGTAMNCGPRAVLSRGSLVSIYSQSPNSITVLAQTASEVLAAPGTGTLGDVRVEAKGVPYQYAGAANGSLQLVAYPGSCPPVFFSVAAWRIGVATSNPTVPIDSCNILLSGDFFPFVFVGSSQLFPVAIPSGVNLSGVGIQAQCMTLGDSCGVTCAGVTPVTLSNTIELLISNP